MSKINTIVSEGKAAYNRNYYIELVNNSVIFDCSDEEYGPISFELELLELKIKEHKEKLNEQKQN